VRAVPGPPSNSFRGFFRDTALIAGFDLRESLRTRRALVLVLLYLLIACAASGVYVQVVREVTAQMKVMAGDEGAAAASALQDEGYSAMLLFFSGGDGVLAAHLASFPPMVLIFAWTSLAFLPWFIALTSYDQIAGDLHQRTIRYAALRTGRGAFVTGKLLGQAALVAGVAGLGMIPVVLIGAIYLPNFAPVATVTALLSTWPITVVCALGFLGVVSLASQLCKGPGAARAVAVGLLFAVWLLSLQSGMWGWLAVLSPWYWKPGLFQPGLVDRLIAVAGCVGLCAGYTALGFLVFRRRDL
jgi:ABC-type transport system involved in multi-copper enzyme maturation permease subunit